MQLTAFRTKVKEYLHQAGYTQKQLAYALGWHPTLLSNKLNGHNFAHLTHAEAKQIICILAQWSAIQTQAQATDLLTDLGLGPHSFSATEWQSAPLKDLLNEAPSQQKPRTEGSALYTSAPRAAETPPKQRPSVAEDVRTGGPALYGRDSELTWLDEQVCQRHARLIGLIGLGGMGKTALATTFSQTVKNHFDFIISYSLHNAPPLETVLTYFLQSVTGPEQIHRLPPAGERQQLLARTLESLKQARCLLILDNYETVLAGGEQSGTYLPGYGDYGDLLDLVGQQSHQSCMIVTSREKPTELAMNEKRYPDTVLSLELHGLTVTAGRALLTDANETETVLRGTEQEWQQVIAYYAGNALALKLLVEPLTMLFGGSLTAFLAEQWGVFSDLQNLLTQQIARLSAEEQEVLYRFAVERQPLSLDNLKTASPWPVSGKMLADTLLVLRRRCLLEESGNSGSFAVQPVILEYLTERLVEHVVAEIKEGKIEVFLDSYALLKAETKDFIRESQRNLILLPILNRLTREVRSHEQVVEMLWQLVAQLRMRPLEETGYAGGNLINLLIEMKADLSGADFAYMRIWQADLRGVALPGVNFTGSDLHSSLFMHAFQAVEAVAFSPDGRLLASGGLERTVRVWDVATGQCLNIFEGHQARIWSLAFSPDGRTVASGADDTVKLWDVANGECRRTLPGQSLGIRSVTFSPDGSRIALCGVEIVGIWEIESTQEPLLCTGHTDEIWSVAFSPDGRLLASGSADHSIRLWDVATGTCRAVLTEDSDWVWSVAFSPDGTLLASACSDQKVRLWDSATGQCRSIFVGHTNRVYSVAFSPDGALVASGSSDQTIRVWDVASGRCHRIFQGHRNLVKSLAFSPDGTLLASASPDQTVRLWDIASGLCVRTFAGYSNRINAVSYHPSGQSIAIGSDDSTIRIWDALSGVLRTTLRGHTSYVKSVAWSRDGTRVASGSADHTVRVWDIEREQCIAVLRGYPSWVWSVDFNQDGTRVVGSGNDETAHIWDIASRHCRIILRGHTQFVRRAIFSPDGTLIASASLDHTLRLWESGTGTCLATLTGHTAQVTAVAFSPDGQWLASGSSDQTVRLWDIASGQCRLVLQEHTNSVWVVAFSPDGKMLASGSDDRTIRLWDAKTGRCLFALPQQTDLFRSLAFAPTGTHLVSADGSYLRVWDVQNGECIRSIKNPGLYEGMNIFGVRGLNPGQEENLIALGAVRF